jgi:HD-like signal output (HDOD) protein
MNQPQLPLGTVQIPDWGEMPLPVRGTWQSLAAEIPIPADAQLSSSNKIQLYELSPMQWEKYIGSDPVLAGKVLAVANSAAFGQSRHVTSLARAVLLLGYNMLETILMAYHLEGVIGRWPSYPKEHFEFVRRWCAAASVCGFHLARAAHYEDPETLGTSSLLARLGTLVLGLAWPAPGPEYARMPNEIARLQYELGRWKAATCHLSMMVAQQWGLPDELAEMLGRHSRPLIEGCSAACKDYRPLIVCCATVLGAAVAAGRPLPEYIAQPAYAQLLVNTGTCGLRAALDETIYNDRLAHELQALGS